MLHLLQSPYNGEPPKSLVTAKQITPNSLHLVRNHGGIPDIDASEFTLKLDELVKNPMSPTLTDLRNEDLFPRAAKLVTIQCRGTRRIEQIDEYAGESDEMINAPWAEGAIGTARWTGLSLKKSHQVLRWHDRRRKAPGALWRRTLFQAGGSDELRRLHPLVES